MKLVKDIILSIIMIPFALIGLGLFIIFGMVHFTMWWIRRLKKRL
jgi:hypothetical protein